jgi:DNA-binding MarR family transcriptional regulator
MRLEEEIKTKGFRNEYHKLSVNLIYTYHWLTNCSAVGFQEFGITPQQFNILRILRGQHPNPCTIQLLKSRMLDRQSDTSRLVDRLSSKGWVERHVCPVDRRKMDVKITDAGLDLLAQMEPMINDSDKLFDQLNEQEAQMLNNLLDRIRQHQFD